MPDKIARSAMKAAVLHTPSQSPRCEQFADPIAHDGEVILEVRAASLKPVDKQLASGSHYASNRAFPFICGVDGVGILEDGKRVFFGGPRPPYGAMAERTVAYRAFTFPIPDNLNDETAAAIVNPGVSAWLSLAQRAKLEAGEHVLILGATGITGSLAVQIAKALGAARVVAAGRNRERLNKLTQIGADAIIQLDTSATELQETIAREAETSCFQVVLDYVWGCPAEAFFAAMTRKEFAAVQAETRYVQIGESAGATISLPAAVLRSTPITIMGTAGIPPREVLIDAMQKVMTHAANGELRIATERVPLADIEAAWNRETQGKRLVFVP
jgi:NADPH:quinone reductase-like Zn-dependent oxidoreductase